MEAQRPAMLGAAQRLHDAVCGLRDAWRAHDADRAHVLLTEAELLADRVLLLAERSEAGAALGPAGFYL